MAAPLSTPTRPEAEYALLRQMARTFGTIRCYERADGRADVYIACWIEGEEYRLRHAELSSGIWVRYGSEEVAYEILESIRADIRGGTPPLAAIAPYLKDKAPEMLFGACWRKFVEKKVRQGRRDGDRQLSRKRIAEFEGHERRGHLEPLLDKPAYRIDYGVLEDWRDWLFDETGLAPGTIHHVIADVGTCLRWLKERHQIREVPKLPPVSIPENPKHVPAEKVQAAILAEIPLELRGQFLVRGFNGLRPSEAWRTSRADWDRESKSLRVRGKGGKVRTLPIHPDVEHWLEEHAAPIPANTHPAAVPLFPNPRGEAPGWWTKASSRRVWLAACRKVDVEFEENASLRHAFGTYLANEDEVDMEKLSRFMGHTDLRTTRRYTKLGPRGLVSVLRKRV